MNARDLLSQWQRGLHVFHKVHEQAAARFERRGRPAWRRPRKSPGSL